MFKTQSSSQQEEGFFRPTQKIVQIKNKNDMLQNINMKDQGFDHHVNQIVSNSRPNDYKARIMKKFVKFIQYFPQIDSIECHHQRQKLKKLQVQKNQEKPKKFYSLEEKYKNNQNYRQVYCKLADKHQFDSYIFSLQKTTDYNQKDFIISSFEQKDHQTNDYPQKDIQFDSNFQSGNLFYAFQKVPKVEVPQYDLLIQNDTNTKGYNQWFFFSVSNFKHKKVQINIVNFTKKHLMFEDGVRPVSFSQKDRKWKFVGQNVQYKKSYVHRYVQVKDTSLSKNYYTLSFLLDCPFVNDKIYVALNYPYTYKKLINFINTLMKETPKQIAIKKQNLCYSISNNMIPYLIISGNQQNKMLESFYKKSQKKKKNNANKVEENTQIHQINIQKSQVSSLAVRRKKNIVILARQHPGQTVGSYVLQGFLRQLCLKASQTSKRLLKSYDFYVVPMINVDGVIYGNFRTNLAGFDLNRQWIDPNKWLHPQIFYLKKLISSLSNIEFVLDFHGHSKKLNSFIYSCTNPPPTLPQLIQTPPKNLNFFRLYPYLFSKQSQLFSLKDCTYTVSQDKMRTARINTFKALNFHPFVFTLQTGFYGYTQNQCSYRYQIKDFFKIGKGAFQSLKKLLMNHKQTKKCLKQIQDKQYLFDKWTYQNKEDLGSQSNPSQDELNVKQLQQKVMPSNIINKTQQEQFQQKEQVMAKKQNIRQKILKKMVNKIKEKSQKNLEIVIPEKKIQPETNQKSPSPLMKYKKKSKSGRNNRVAKVLDSIQKKKMESAKDEMGHNYLQVKQAKVQKPSYKNNENKQQRQEASFRSHKKQSIKTKKEDIKSASNLLGTGYFQRKQSFFQNKLFRETSKGKIEGSHKQSHQMMVSPYAYPSTNLQSILSKLGPLSNLRQRTRTISLQVQQQQKQKNTMHKEKLYIIKQNKVVKVVNSTNKEKPKSVYLNQTLQQQILNRTQALKNCQKAMRDLIDQDDIGINQIKEDIFKISKKTSLRPLVNNSRKSSKNKLLQ